MRQIQGSGRKQSLEWAEVIRVENTSKVKCKYCHQELTSKIERIKVHLEKCANRNPNPVIITSSQEKTNQSYESLLISVDSPSTSESQNINMSSGSAFPSVSTSSSPTQSQLSPSMSLFKTPSKKFKTIQPKVGLYTVTTSTEQKNCIDKNIPKFFYE